MAFIVCVFKRLIRYTIYGMLTLAALIYAPFLLDLKPESYSIPLPTFQTGVWKQNDLLSKTEHLFKGHVRGPESIAEHKGDLYTALIDGRIIRIRNGKFTTVADVSEVRCEGPWEQSKCGRPLAVRFDSKGMLYVIDAYHGIKRVDIPSGKGTVTTVFSTKTKVDGRQPIFVDDFAILEGGGAKGGNVYYISEASSKWAVKDVIYSYVEHEKTGRIIKFDEDSKMSSVVASGFSFANGVELTDARDALLICEFNARRVLKYYIKGSKAGKVEPILENLPGEPDNIRRSSDPKKETYWIALLWGRNSTNPTFVDALSNKPLLRKAVFRALHGIGTAVSYLGTVMDYVPLKEVGFEIKSNAFIPFFHHPGLIAEVDANGKVLRALHSPDGQTTSISEVREVMEGNKKVLYIGSFYNDYVGKLYIS